MAFGSRCGISLRVSAFFSDRAGVLVSARMWAASGPGQIKVCSVWHFAELIGLAQMPARIELAQIHVIPTNILEQRTLCWSGTEFLRRRRETHPFVGNSCGTRVASYRRLMSDVPLRRRYGRRHRRRSRRRALVGAIVVLSSLMLVAALSALSNAVADLRTVVVVELPGPPPMEIADRVRPPHVPARPVFRHSVVSGGVYSADDVEAAMAQDRIVAAHYSGMNARELRVETLSEDRRVYMSYRLGDEIFWTKQRVRLPKGENILTDGVHHIRARCGNCIAFAPMAPTADAEPDEAEFDALADEAVQSRMPLGSEVLLQPFAGVSFPWLLGFPSGDIAHPDSSGSGWNGVPVYGYRPDPTQLLGDPSEFVFYSVDDDVRSVNGFTPTFVPPAFFPPGDPRGPGDPGVLRDPGDPGDPGPGDPFNPNFPPLENPVVAAPEPGTLLLVGGGLATLAARRRSRSSHRARRR
jgi:hypothetical protein